MSVEIALAAAVVLMATGVIAPLSQWYKSHTTSLVAGISPWFFRLWLMGDACALIAAIESQAPLFVVAFFVYLCIVDAGLVAQWFKVNHSSIVTKVSPVVASVVFASRVQAAPVYPGLLDDRDAPITVLVWLWAGCHVLAWALQIRRNQVLQLVLDMLVTFVLLLVVSRASWLVAEGFGLPSPIAFSVMTIISLMLALVAGYQIHQFDHYVAAPQPVSLNTSDWYPFEVQAPAVEDLCPLETTLLLAPAPVVPKWIGHRNSWANYTTSPPPSHYVSRSVTTYSYHEPRLALESTLHKAAFPHDPTLIPLLIGTYSLVLKKMMESKTPFTPHDFLSDDFMNTNRH